MALKSDIVAMLARRRTVETMVQNIAHGPLSADLKDLVQMVYMVLLEYDDAKIADLWAHGQLRFFIARVIINQFRSSNSPFHAIYRKWQERSCDIAGLDFIDEER